MMQVLIFLAMIGQLAVVCLIFVWILAFLGFTDETNKRASARVIGKILVMLCVLLAILPIGITLWVSVCYYFSPAFYRQLPLGLFLPVVTLLCSLLLCAGMIYLFKVAGYKKNS